MARGMKIDDARHVWIPQNLRASLDYIAQTNSQKNRGRTTMNGFLFQEKKNQHFGISLSDLRIEVD